MYAKKNNGHLNVPAELTAIKPVINAIANAVFIVDEQARILMANNYCQPYVDETLIPGLLLTGFIDNSQNDLTQDNFEASIHSCIQQYLLQKLDAETDKIFAISFRNSKNELIYGRLTFNPLLLSSRFSGALFLVSFVKSSVFKIPEKTYVKYEYLQMIFDNTSDAIFLAPISKDGIHQNFIVVNNEACNRLGYSREELLQLNAKTLNPEPNSGRIRAYGNLMQKEGGAIFEAIHLTKDGTSVPVQVHASIIRVDHQDFVLSVTKDLRPYKKSEDEQALFGRLMDYSWNEIYVIDSQTLTILMANEGALKNLGLRKDELLAINFTDILVDTSYEQFLSFTHELFVGKTEQLVYESQLKRKNGSTYPVEVRLQISQSEVPPVLFANIQDISERKKIERRLMYLANYDSLTGLPNRELYLDRLQVAMEAVKRQDKLMAVLFIDLDGFKQINDTYGHEVGDQLLREVAKKLVKSIRKSDTVARFGGDEFTVILNNIEYIGGITIVAEKILKNITEPLVLNGKEIITSPSIGITVFPFCDRDDASELLRQSDVAMYHAKKAGKRTYVYYSSELSLNEARRTAVERAAKTALKRGELEIFYQPRVCLKDRSIVSAEALLRWQHPTLGFISPVEFIPLMEKIGIINEVGEWVLREGCKQLRQWMDQGHKFRLSVNVSARQFENGTLHEIVAGILLETGVSGDCLEIEITEGLLIEQSEHAAAPLNKIKEQGVLISLDDFGTGYSSLSYLKQFPIDILKIDRSFVMDLKDSKDSHVIVEAIIGLAKNLGLSVTAEGIEEAWHADFLSERGCDEGQGYYFAKPMNKDKMQHLLENSQDIISNES